MRGLRDRTFVVTGSGSGIGRATALHLVESGANVALVDQATDAAAAVAKETTDPSRAFVVGCDVSDVDEVATAVRRTQEHFGPLHGAVTSAGIFDPVDLADIGDADPDVFERVIGVNLRGTFLTLRAVLPRLERGSAIVTVASTAGLRGHGFGAAYTSSKGGVIALTRLAAVQYGPRGVRVNCVCPGATAGEGMGSTFLDPEFAATMSRDVPLRRVGAAAELGSTIATLLSDESSYVTGQVIAVDGGATVR